MSSKYKQTQVFTPEWATKAMLSMLDRESWKDHSTYLFEPTCGDGELLIVCLKDIYAQLQELYESKERALVETMFKFFALEIDPEMTVKCRERIYNWIATESEGMDESTFSSLMVASLLQDRIRNQDFFKFMDSKSVENIRLMK